MTNLISPDVLAQIKELQKEGLAHVAETRDKSREKQKREIEKCLKRWKNKSASDVVELATKMGYKIESGGVHTHIVKHEYDEDKRKTVRTLVTELPTHGGGRNLASGTLRSILNDMSDHWDRK